MTSSVATASADAFRTRIRGEIITPTDAGYDSARSVWNAMIDKRPLLIVRCAGAADVIATVNFARDNHLPLAVRGGAHNIAGHSTCDGGVVIDFSRMKSIRVDAALRTVRAEPGVRWEELDQETQAFGLATTGGTVGDTGIAGLTLGGGFGWLGGKHGLTVDNVIAVDLVLASGELVTVNADQHPDLFWSIRGGSGNFGVATSFEYRAHPVGPMITGGLVLHPLDRAAEMVRFYRDFLRTVPDELTTAAALVTSPEGHKMAAMAVAYCGSLEDGAKAVAPIKAFGTPALDAIGPLPYVAQQSLFKDGFPNGLRNYLKADFVRELPDSYVEAAIEHYSAAPSPRSVVLWFPLSGKVTRVAPDATAYPHRTGIHAGVYAIWADPAKDAVNIEWAREGGRLMQPVSAGGVYVNELGLEESDDRIRGAYGVNYARLSRVKAQYDPENLFRLNANIAPAT